MANLDTSQLIRTRVIDKTTVSEGIVCVLLAACDGQALPPFSAGAHIDVHLPGGLVRQYSLCGNPDDLRNYRIAVLLDQNSRGGSSAVHMAVSVGDELTISAPRNHFALAAAAQQSLLIAGGIGITPILAMAECLAKAEKPFSLLYRCRSRSRAAFLDEMTASKYAASIQCLFDDVVEDGTERMGKAIATAAPGTHLYVCGPKGLIDAVVTSAREAGIADEHIHFELFRAEVHDRDAEHTSFSVRLARSGREFKIPPEKSILDVLLTNGIDVQYSCGEGVCGACLTPVLDGCPDHQDLYLSETEKQSNNVMAICCSRSHTSSILLDL